MNFSLFAVIIGSIAAIFAIIAGTYRAVHYTTYNYQKSKQIAWTTAIIVFIIVLLTFGIASVAPALTQTQSQTDVTSTPNINQTDTTVAATATPTDTPIPTDTPSPTVPTTFNPTNVSLPFTFQCPGCHYSDFKLVLVSITPNAEQGTNWNFDITNNGLGACNYTYIFNPVLVDQDGQSHNGSSPPPVNINAGSTIHDIAVTFYLALQSGGHYTFTPNIDSNCDNGYDTYSSQNFDF